MSKDPKTGRQLREIEKLDKRWRAEGKQEGRTQNKLAHKLGIAARDGIADKADRMRGR